MKSLLLFPPQWIPVSPHLAGPAIHSILKNHGHETRLRDLNAEFYNTALTSGFLYDAVKNAFADFEQNAAELLNRHPDEASLKDQPSAVQARVARYRAIFAMAQRNEYKDVIRGIDAAIALLRDPEAFYDPARVDAALTVVDKACGVLSATHHPSGVYFLHPNVKIYYSIESLQEHCQNVAGNVFHGFFTRLLPDLLADKPQFIGISLGDYSQLLGGLTLAMLLKQATDAHICIGGNLFGRYTDVLVNNPAFFRLFADSVIYNEGEKPVIELLKRLEAGSGFDGVPNLMYLGADGRIVCNEDAPPYPIDSLFHPEFSQLPARRYFLPELIYNIQASRNCYWQKCSFCTHHAGSRYAIKPVDKMLAEIKALCEAHGARYFHFIDEAVSPSYLKRLSQGILDAGLDINFYIYGRFEKAFDREVFKLAHRAGLRMVLWGFESASERIYRLMNKGELADKNERLKILQAAHDEGIWNFLFLMFDFPTETLKEAKETVDFVRDHRHMLSHSSGSSFMLVEDSPILSNPKRFSITSVQRVRNGFSFAHRFTTNRGKTPEQKKELEAYKAQAWGVAEKRFRNSSFREKLFLYVCRFGVAKVSAMNREIWL